MYFKIFDLLGLRRNVSLAMLLDPTKATPNTTEINIYFGSLRPCLEIPLSFSAQQGCEGGSRNFEIQFNFISYKIIAHSAKFSVPWLPSKGNTKPNFSTSTILDSIL